MGQNESLVFSPAGQAVTKHFEGLRLSAYADSGGVATIGWGHTLGVMLGMTITENIAEAYFQSDCREAERIVKYWVSVPLTQGQFDALVDFVFNVGPGIPGRHDGLAFMEDNLGGPRSSKLLQLLNLGQYNRVPEQFQRWVWGLNSRGDSISLPGLYLRRDAECALWFGEAPSLPG
jgi:lysozyme